MEFKITVGIYLDKNQKGCEIVCAENYKIIALDGMVQAYSKERISYQPLGWRKEFRGALRSALSELRVTEKQCLITSYYEPEMGSFDLENILFYNIGVASFRQIATKRIFAENCSQQKASESDKETEFSHRYTYKICDSETHRDFWANRILAAEWDPVPVSGLFSVNKVVDYWQTLRDNPDKIKSYLRIPENPFGVKIKLSIPKTKTVNLTSVVKPLLDGVVCAFHSANHRLQEECSQIAPRLGVTERQLLCTDNDILGACRFIYPYREKSVKWNPQDNRCFAFDIEAEHNDDDVCRFSGKIYELSFCKDKNAVADK